ncbi:MAG: hypothetical protein NTW87_18280 [Planctomycetota bacterium]|nr:hypothetical protein [Planctomycetota bacterium]
MKRTMTALLCGLVSLALLAGQRATFAEEAKKPVRPVAKDTTTVGKWKSKYGKKAAWIAITTDTAAKQAGYALEIKDAETYTWSENDKDDKRVPQPPKDDADAPATCWYNGETFSLVVTPPDDKPYKVTLYVMDYDHQSRVVEIVDPAKQTLEVTSAETDGGIFLTWVVEKAVTFEVRKKEGPNGVVSAVLIDAAE